MSELLWRTKRFHRGDVKLRGPNGELVTTAEYTDNMGNFLRMYRLSRQGSHVGYYSSVEGLAKHVNLRELVEDDDQLRSARETD